MAKYPLKKDDLAAARLEVKEAKANYNEAGKAQNKIKNQVRKDNPVIGFWTARSEAEREHNRQQREQDKAVRVHNQKAKVATSSLLKELRKKEAVMANHHTAKQEEQNKNSEIRKAKQEAAREIRLNKKFPYTDDQKDFMGKNRDQFHRTKKAFTMYKKAWLKDSDGELCTPCVITMEVPSKTARVAGGHTAVGMSGTKIRVAEAVVTDIHLVHGCDLGDETDRVAYAQHDKTFSYKKGKTVKPKADFDTDKSDCCGSGIHGYLGISAAIKY